MLIIIRDLSELVKKRNMIPTNPSTSVRVLNHDDDQLISLLLCIIHETDSANGEGVDVYIIDT